MKLIDEKKFLEEFNKYEDTGLPKIIKEILSKHLKDLPNKRMPGVNKDGSRHGWSSYNAGVNWYNQCLEDCEGK